MLTRLFLIALPLLIGCQAAPQPNLSLTGDMLVQKLQASTLPITNLVAYDSATDPNSLLGRPNQYTAKVVWNDTRAPQDSLATATIEVFANPADLQARYTYTDAISKSGGAFARYIYRNDERLLLLRLPKELTPEQADEYRVWLATF